jgi:hypothetical protein
VGYLRAATFNGKSGDPNVPAVVGIPEIAPDELSVRPGGSDPFVRANDVYGGVPPLATRADAYETLAVPVLTGQPSVMGGWPAQPVQVQVPGLLLFEAPLGKVLKTKSRTGNPREFGELEASSAPDLLFSVKAHCVILPDASVAKTKKLTLPGRKLLLSTVTTPSVKLYERALIPCRPLKFEGNGCDTVREPVIGPHSGGQIPPFVNGRP